MRMIAHCRKIIDEYIHDGVSLGSMGFENEISMPSRDLRAREFDGFNIV
jgi:hypothetical protein